MFLAILLNQFVFVWIVFLVSRLKSSGSVLFFPPADGCCVEFRLASCGQDSRVKVWSLPQQDGSGRLGEWGEEKEEEERKRERVPLH